MFENVNSTAAEQVASGEQETVVESQTESFGAEEQEVSEENRRSDFDLVSDGQESVVDSQQESGDDEVAHVGEDGGEGRQPEGTGQAGAGKQSREENAAMRSMRLRAQQEAAAAERARTDEIIANSGGVNPYTGKPFTGLQDYLEYAKMYRESAIQEEAKKSGKTVEEVTEEMDDRDFVRNLRRQQVQQSAEQQKNTDEMEFLRRDVMNFVEKYPNVDVAQLENNQHFLDFCGTRFKKEPLADLYGSYLGFKGGVEQAAAAKAASRAQRSTGGGTSGGTALTPSQQSMLDKWNAENPDMPMTAKDLAKFR